MIDEGWHLDKKVPIAIIGAILLQTSTIVWWASGVEHRMQTFETRLAELSIVNKSQDTRVDGIEVERRINLQRLSRTEQALEDIKTFMMRVDSKLDRMSEKRP